MRIIAPPRLLRADAPSLSILRRVMSGVVAFTAGHLANAPHGLFVRSDALFRCAECIMHRVFWVYRSKARVRPPRSVLRPLSCYIPFFRIIVFEGVGIRAHRHMQLHLMTSTENASGVHGLSSFLEPSACSARSLPQCVLLTFFDQAAASIRIAASPSIFDAASNGDCSLVQDYLALDPSCVHSREEGR